MTRQLLLLMIVCSMPFMGWTTDTRAAGPLTRPSRITFDEGGALLVDGQAVFPITLTIIPPPDAKAPNGKHAYEEFRNAGCLFMRTGGPDFNQETIEQEKRYQEAAARYGMRCSPWLGWKLGNVKPGDAGEEENLRKVVNAFKGSPGLGLWKGSDEPAWGKKPPADVINSARIIHELDPDHPIWLVQAPRGTVDALRTYDRGWDVGGIDIYPISYPPGVHSIDANKEMSMVGDFTRMMRQVAGGKPFWMTLQIAFSGTTPPKGVIRFPTFFEQRFMSYEAIISGSRGLTYFGGGLLPTLSERDKQYGWNWTYWERVMKPLLQELGTSSPIEAALVAPDSKLPVKVEGEKQRLTQKVYDASPVELLVREAGNDVYLLACKMEGPVIQVRISGLPAECKTGQVMFEEPRVVQAQDGSFIDWFAPFDVHVYRFSRK
jgi:hypothetical protein